MIDWLRICFLKQALKAVHFVEQSRELRIKQRQKLLSDEVKSKQKFLFPQDEKNEVTPDAKGIRVYWHDSVEEFRAWGHKKGEAKTRTLIVAQEFLDALPVYSFEKTSDGTFRECLVDVALRKDLQDELVAEEKEKQTAETTKESPVEPPEVPEEPNKSDSLTPRLRLILAPEVTPPLKTLLPIDEDGRLPNDDSPVGSVIEVCPQAILFAEDVDKIVSETNGAALFTKALLSITSREEGKRRQLQETGLVKTDVFPASTSPHQLFEVKVSS